MSTINQIQVGETTYDVGVNLSNVSGINISSPSSGQVLKYNGSGWVNGTVESGGSSETTLVVNTDTTISLTLDNNTMYWCSSSAIVSLSIAGVATGFEYASLTFTAQSSGTTFGMPDNGDYYCVGKGCSGGEFSPVDGMRYNLAIHQEPDRIAIYVAEAF